MPDTAEGSPRRAHRPGNNLIRDFEMPAEMLGAVCRESDPEEWFPEKGANTKLAKDLCWSCPVRIDCAAGAVRRRETFGIWGGYSARQIQVLYLSPVQGCEPPPIVQPREIHVPSKARIHPRSRAAA